MIAKFIEKLKKCKQDNQGAAIVVVIVAIAFIGMLIAMLAYMAYYNYLMKHVDRSSKDNFYSAEYALDVLNAGLQKDISDSMSEAYVNAVKSNNAEAVGINFQKYFIEDLQKREAAAPSDLDHWSKTHLENMWVAAGLTVAANAGEEGAYLEKTVTGSGTKDLIPTDTKHLSLNGIRIVYTDQRGFVSIIETDIRMKTPNLDLAQSAANLNVDEYSLIANVSLVNDSNSLDPNPFSVTMGVVGAKISGNVYGGKEGVKVANVAGITFIEDPAKKAAGKDLDYKLIADSINVENTLTNANAGVFFQDDKYTTYVSDINVTSAKFTGDGNMYVGDDMDIAGKKSNVTLKGVYRGYGNQSNTAMASSSILINGANTTLNFANLKELTLAGHAYVGAKRYDADKDRLTMATNLDASRFGEDNDYTTGDVNAIMANTGNVPAGDKIDDMDNYEEVINSTHYDDWVQAQTDAATLREESYDVVPRNDADILVGESMSVKANQLFYMVPTDCIGYYRNSTIQKYARNPMTYAEYKHLCTALDKDSQAYKDFVAKKTDGTYVNAKYAAFATDFKTKHGGKEPGIDDIPADIAPEEAFLYDPVRLSVLWNRMGTPSYTSKWKPVYRRINGTVMVYLYLDFGNDEQLANEFYKSYYDYDKASINMYVNSYIEKITWGSALNNNLSLAGNAFRMNGRDVVLLKDDLNDSVKFKKMGDYQEQYSAQYESLMHILSEEDGLMTGTEANTDLFDNLVVRTAIREMEDQHAVFSDGSISAYVGTSDVKYPGTKCPENTVIIITSGNVYLTADFDGLVMAGGNIYICKEGSKTCDDITYNPEKVRQAMKLTFDASGKTYHVYDAFGPKGEATYGLGTTADSGEAIKLNELITYQNWKKE